MLPTLTKQRLSATESHALAARVHCLQDSLVPWSSSSPRAKLCRLNTHDIAIHSDVLIRIYGTSDQNQVTQRERLHDVLSVVKLYSRKSLCILTTT